MNASGCGVMVKDYGHLLADDPVYANKAQRVSQLCRDVSELLPEFKDALIGQIGSHPSLVWFTTLHVHCSMVNKSVGRLKAFSKVWGFQCIYVLTAIYAAAQQVHTRFCKPIFLSNYGLRNFKILRLPVRNRELKQSSLAILAALVIYIKMIYLCAIGLKSSINCCQRTHESDY